MGNRFLLIGAHLQREDVEGIEGAAIFPAGELYLSASDYDPAEGIANRATILRVAAIRQNLTERATFVAIRYGVTLRDASEIVPKCGAHFETWNRVLRAYRGKVEMTLKIAASQNPARPDRKAFHRGRDYILELQRLRSSRAAGPEIRSEIESIFRPVAARLRWVDREDGATELALLVERNQLPHARSAGEELKERLSELPFLLSGPWPLEVFADGQ